MSPKRSITLDRPRLLAILNTTPDSFFPASRAAGVDDGLARALAAVLAGADALDLGGESTRPGARRVDAAEQIARVVPLVIAIRASPPPLAEIPISIDTTLVEVARAALDAGADAINDVSAAIEGGDDMLALAAERGSGLILMHRLLPPDRDQFSDRYDAPPRYADVATEVAELLAARARAATRAGVQHDAILLDPGLGFGKTPEQNLELVRRTPELLALGYPLLSAASRKSFVGRVASPDIPQTDPADRLAGSLAFSVEHLARGLRLFRVHDVAPQRQALLAAWAIHAGEARRD
ncbi:MAG: dihydropteroate synthase [Phycisphaerales bacterium]|nr:dihydropteroate synthase [Phycisphaerales bacterium]